LKILLPELDLTLIECKRKKALFLERLCSELGLDLCTVVRSRAEELAGAREYAASYHLVLARLVSSTARVCALARPLLAPGGLLICYKGPEGIDDLLSVSCVLQPFGCVSLPHALSRPAAFVLFVRK
jgi:16S rRNA (guanine527-N7)-methyltransferase